METLSLKGNPRPMWDDPPSLPRQVMIGLTTKRAKPNGPLIAQSDHRDGRFVPVRDMESSQGTFPRGRKVLTPIQSVPVSRPLRKIRATGTINRIASPSEKSSGLDRRHE